MNPTYHSMGDHTESVEIDYDPEKTSYRELLDIFWKGHDTTASNSRQYMSAVFYHDKEQQQAAQETMLKQRKSTPITTAILPAAAFYPAELYHQKYMLQQHPTLCSLLDLDPSGSDLLESHAAARLNGYIAGYGTAARFHEESPQLGITEACVNYVKRRSLSRPASNGC